MAKSKSFKKSKSRLTRRQLSVLARPRTRRRSDDTDDDEVRERIRRARYPPGVIDSWLSRVQCEALATDPSCAIHSEEEVLCTVYLEYKEHPETHKGFDDGGVYTLYLCLATPPSASASATTHGDVDATVQTAQMALATYDGWNTCMDAPRWTTLDPNPNSKFVFWESREEVAEVLGRVAAEQEQAFIRQVAAMSLR